MVQGLLLEREASDLLAYFGTLSQVRHAVINIAPTTRRSRCRGGVICVDSATRDAILLKSDYAIGDRPMWAHAITPLDLTLTADEQASGKRAASPDEEDDNSEDNNNLKYCTDLSGVLCSKNDVCSGDNVDSRDGTCCIGTCKLPEPASLAWIGYLLVGIILLVVAIMWLKYKKIKPKDKLEKKIKPVKKDLP